MAAAGDGLTATWRCCRACLRPIPGVPGRSSVWRISVRPSRCWALPPLRSTRVGSTAPRSSCRPRISLGPRRRRLRVGAPGRCRRRPPRRRGPPRRPVRPPGPPARWGMARQLRCSAHIAHFGSHESVPARRVQGRPLGTVTFPGHFAPKLPTGFGGLTWVSVGQSPNGVRPGGLRGRSPTTPTASCSATVCTTATRETRSRWPRAIARIKVGP